MSLQEIARYSDVYEAELAAAFLASRGIETSLAERHLTTMDPLMQRALGIRVMTSSSRVEEARSLLSRVRDGEFAGDDDDYDPIDRPEKRGLIVAALTMMAFLTGGAHLGFAATGLKGPRKAIRIAGVMVIVIIIAASVGALLALDSGLLGPSRPVY